jgi:gluconolactonase
VILRIFVGVCICFLSLMLLQCSDSDAPVADAVKAPSHFKFPLVQGEWETLAGGYVYSDSPVADAEDNIYFSAIFQSRIYRIDPTGDVTVFDEDTAQTMGLAFSHDGRLIACRRVDAQIIAYDMQGGREVLLQGVPNTDPEKNIDETEFCNGIVVGPDGGMWFVDRVNENIVFLASDGSHRVVASGYRSNGIVLSNNGKMLVTTDSNDPKLWAYDVHADGSLTEKPGYFEPVRVLPKKVKGLVTSGNGKPGSNGMAIDKKGRFYVATFMGVQVFNPDGSFAGFIKGLPGYMSGITFAGPESDFLYATGMNALYRISIDTSGDIAGEADASDVEAPK